MTEHRRGPQAHRHDDNILMEDLDPATEAARAAIERAMLGLLVADGVPVAALAGSARAARGEVSPRAARQLIGRSTSGGMN